MTDPFLPIAPLATVTPVTSAPQPGDAVTRSQGSEAPVESCDVCGSTDVVEIRCKVICRNCRTILKTCSDL